jgi:hypothetical protein
MKVVKTYVLHLKTNWNGEIMFIKLSIEFKQLLLEANSTLYAYRNSWKLSINLYNNYLEQ